MELACSLERGSFCTQGSITQRSQRPCWASHLIPCGSVFVSSNVISVKCATIINRAQKRVAAYTDSSLGLATSVLTLTSSFAKAEGGRHRAPAASVSLRVHSRRKCAGCGHCDSFSSSTVFCLPLDLLGSRLPEFDLKRCERLAKKQHNLETMLGYRGQLEKSAAHGFRGNRIGRTLCELHEFRARWTGKRRQSESHRHVCQASGQEDKGKADPDDENAEGTSDPVSRKEGDALGASSPQSEPESDWRAFRARLVVSEHQASDRTDTESKQGNAAGNELAGTLPKRWAHPILAPETGCVLIATDKIDGQQSFERSVILLLSPGSTNPREGPYGLILNRPLSCRIKDIKPKDRTLVKFFGNCQVHHGGPLDEDMFLLLHGTEGVRGYREVIPGVYYGAASGLEEIMRGRRPLDYRFFFGYSGWSVDQLKKEIEQGLWCVAACSTDLITGHSAAGLWEEILMLMGGKYAELSKRPRRKHF